jgi:glucose-1-phosphate adenylyltransferase
MTLRDDMRNTQCILMAGGKGERLYPLTKARAKPSVRFGGIYRIVDFTLSNCLNSGMRRIYVLTQYRSLSLDRHIRLGWSIFNHELDEFIECVPPQQRNVDRWYRGTADSIFQNVYLLQRERPERVMILSGDHVYKMNYNHMLEFHMEKQAHLTVAAVEVNRTEATGFGVIAVDEESRIVGWEEKPADPKPMPGKPDKALASMGVYIFDTETLVKSVIADAKNPNSSHDFGKDVVPKLMETHRVYVHSFREPHDPEGRYWRDIGTLDAYWAANMDICSAAPQCNLHDTQWPIRTYQEQVPPARIVTSPADGNGAGPDDGTVINSLISGGCVLSGGNVARSVLSRNVRLEAGSLVEDSVVLDNVHVSRGAKIRKAIIDQDVVVPEGFAVGHDPEFDRSRFTISPDGVVIIPRGMVLR